MLNKQMVIFINFPLFQVPNSLQRAFENGDDDMGKPSINGGIHGISPIWGHMGMGK